MHYDLDNLPWENVAPNTQLARALLREGDSAVNPASTKGVIYGPAEVRYWRHPDGGIDVRIGKLPVGPEATANLEARRAESRGL